MYDGVAREQSRRTVAVATVIMDRVIALWGLFWFVALLGGAFWLTGRSPCRCVATAVPNRLCVWITQLRSSDDRWMAL